MSLNWIDPFEKPEAAHKEGVAYLLSGGQFYDIDGSRQWLSTNQWAVGYWCDEDQAYSDEANELYLYRPMWCAEINLPNES